jgi:hypothetical protein
LLVLASARFKWGRLATSTILKRRKSITPLLTLQLGDPAPPAQVGDNTASPPIAVITACVWRSSIYTASATYVGRKSTAGGTAISLLNGSNVLE